MTGVASGGQAQRLELGCIPAHAWEGSASDRLLHCLQIPIATAAQAEVSVLTAQTLVCAVCKVDMGRLRLSLFVLWQNISS